MKGLKKIPRFESEEKEFEFWSIHNSTEYIDYSKAERVVFPNLKPSLKTISIRMPESLIAYLKVLANKRDMSYQSLMKLFLSERVEKEFPTVRL